MALDDISQPDGLSEIVAAGKDRDSSEIVVSRNSFPTGQQDPQGQQSGYNPFVVRPNMTWDDRTMDRMITIKRPAVTVSGEMWITDSGFAEVLSLLPLNSKEQKLFWRKLRKIQMQASGELNKKIIDTRQERLMMELVSQKSRLDVAQNGNLNEREMWVTTRQQIEQTLRTPAPSQPKGFLGSVLSGITGR